MKVSLKEEKVKKADFDHNNSKIILLEGVGVGLLDGIKNIYFSLEDGYYRFLDRLQDHIPVYSIVDPIDKVIPSFALFLLILIGLVAGGIFLLLQPGAPSTFEAYLKVVNENDQAMPNVPVLVMLGEDTNSYTTDTRGVVRVRIPSAVVNAQVSVEVEGYRNVVEQAVELRDRSTTKIEMELDVPQFDARFTIQVVDETTGELITGISISASFTCETSTTAPPDQFNSGGQFVVNKNAGCGTLYGDFIPTSTYQERRAVPIVEAQQEVRLQPLDSEPEEGTLEVTVNDANNHAVSNVTVQYWTSLTINNPSVAGTTDSQGKVRIESLPTGTYSIQALALDGRRAQQSGVRVSDGATTRQTLVLPELARGKKIFFKAVDADTNEALGGITVRLYDQSTKLGVDGATTSNGLFERNVDVNGGSRFSVVLQDSGGSYLISAVWLNAVDANATQPLLIGLVKAHRDEQRRPVNYAIGVVITRNEEGQVVPNAVVEFYRSDYPNPLVVSRTNADGNVAIHNLPPSELGAPYFAKAYSSENDANGVSDSFSLTAGETVEFPVVLVTGTGTIEVTVVSAENPNQKLAGASVKAFKLVLNPALGRREKVALEEGISDSTGVWRSRPIKINTSVVLEVATTGRRRFYSGEYFISRSNQTVSVLVPLASQQSFPGDACTNDAGCTFPQLCNPETKVCEQSCGGTAECTALGDYYCSPVGLCEATPPNYCESPLDCSSPCQVCENNQCQEPVGQTCSGNENCCGIVCDPFSEPMVCYNPAGDSCTRDEECGGNGFSCGACGFDALGEPINCCRKTCSSNDQCPADMVCDAESVCVNREPTKSIELTLVDIRGVDAQDPLRNRVLLPGQSYTAIFSLSLAKDGNWEDVDLHFRLGPDSDWNATDQNGFVTNIHSALPLEPAAGYPQFSVTTDLSDVFSSPEPPSGNNARQGNTRIARLSGRSDYVVRVSFKIQSGVRRGTVIPFHFMAWGKNNNQWIVTPKHTQQLKVNEALCFPRSGNACDPFVWNFFLNDPDIGIALLPTQSVSLSENEGYQVYYSIANTTTQSFSNARLAVSTLTPVIRVDTSSGFSNQSIPAQSIVDIGLRQPVLFSTASSTTGLVGNLSFELQTSLVHPSALKELAFSVLPKPELEVRFIPFGSNIFMARVSAIGLNGSQALTGALVRVKTHYSRSDWETASFREWEYSCETNVEGQCLITGLSFENAGRSVIVEASKSGFRSKRIQVNITGPVQVFGDPKDCLAFTFDNQANPSPMRYRVARPTEEPFTVSSTCERPLDIRAESLAFLDGKVSVEDLGGAADTIRINPNESKPGRLVIGENSPLGFIPIVLKVKENNVWVSGFIAGRAVVYDPAQPLDIVNDWGAGS